MSRWLAAFEADLAVGLGVTKGTIATKDRSESPIVSFVPTVTGYTDQDHQLPGVPSSWVEGVHWLRSAPPPPSIPLARWRQLAKDAQNFLVHWGTRAADLSWGELDLFGVHQAAPFRRYDAMGLVLLLDSFSVVAMTTNEAEIRTCSGARQRYGRRPPNKEQITVWTML